MVATVSMVSGCTVWYFLQQKTSLNFNRRYRNLLFTVGIFRAYITGLMRLFRKTVVEQYVMIWPFLNAVKLSSVPVRCKTTTKTEIRKIKITV